MSVYTTVHHRDLVAFLNTYELGKLLSFEGINSGIENSNFFLNTTSGQFVLTLFERINADDVKFCLTFTEYLDSQNLHCPRPMRRRDGSYLATLSGKPAAVVQRLPGSSIEQAEAVHCRAAGDWLGHLHRIGSRFPLQRENTFNPIWLRSRTDALRPVLPAAQRMLLQQELAHQSGIDFSSLPKGIIHGDLFRDNVLFSTASPNTLLSGVIDFYYACYDTLLLDLAITINDWCIDHQQHLQPSRVQTLLMAYNRQRPLVEEEFSLLQQLLRYAALRFWVSRSFDLYFPRTGEILQTKNPQIFQSLLLNLREHNDTNEALLSGPLC